MKESCIGCFTSRVTTSNNYTVEYVTILEVGVGGVGGAMRRRRSVGGAMRRRRRSGVGGGVGVGGGGGGWYR